MATMELNAIKDRERRARVKSLLRDVDVCVTLTEECFARAEALVKMGFKSGDAVHVAAAEIAEADVLLTCDDRFCKAGLRHRGKLRVRVLNPVEWVQEMKDEFDA